jgi:hypothetical protein
MMTNLPWLIGSLGEWLSSSTTPYTWVDSSQGTMGEDTIIFLQFHLYAEKEGEESSAIA